MRRFIAVFLMLIFVVTASYAQITITGDARVRPRMDIKTYGDYPSNGMDKTHNNYYLYRARILLSADIGDGYYFKTRLGHNWIAYWAGFFGTGTKPHALSLAAAGRSSVDFMELYFGHTGEQFSWSAGLIPVEGNPLKDIHFYPTLMVDLPYLIFNNNAAHGFNFNYKLAGQNLDLKVLVDNNDGVKVSVDGEVADSMSSKDQYTFDLSYPLSLAGMKLGPELLVTIADEGDPAPMTYGAEFGLPKVAGFSLSAFAGATAQTVSDTTTGLDAYSGWIGRVKLTGNLGPGTLVAWYDVGATTPDIDEAVTSNHSYLWLSYSYTLHKSEHGALTFAPTYRLVNQKTEGIKDYSRAMIELTTQITFK